MKYLYQQNIQINVIEKEMLSEINKKYTKEVVIIVASKYTQHTNRI